MLMDATHELQKLVNAGMRFSLALERNGWFSIRIGNYLTRRFATYYGPTFELAVAALMCALYEWRRPASTTLSSSQFDLFQL